MASEVLNWLRREYADRLAPAVESMTGEPTSTSPVDQPSEPILDGALVLRQPTGLAAGADLWFAVPGESWRPIGRKVLESAGITEATDDEARGTFLEVLQQAVAPLAQVIGGRLGREVDFPSADLDAAPPPGLTWASLQVQLGSTELSPLLLAAAPGFEELLSNRVENEDERGRPDTQPLKLPSPARSSRTMDLLMEVELPVGVSFGRVQMKLRDAVKLTTGSIVELNRRVTEPVEVIVNNCVIARGEVVVVEGNYGVRIQEIVSREERLRTLF